MKKYKTLLIVAMCLTMILGNVISVNAASGTERATRDAFYTADGTEIKYIDMARGISATDEVLSNYASDVYKDYDNVLITKTETDDEIYYNIGFAVDQWAWDPNKQVGGDLYYPRFTPYNTSSNALQYAVWYYKYTDTWKVNVSKSTTNTIATNEISSTDLDELKDIVLNTYLVSSTEKITYMSDPTMVFFPAPKAVLAPIMKEIPMTGATSQILAMIPICLGLLVGFLGLRKALSILETILHKA